jgi:hypothetical protein
LSISNLNNEARKMEGGGVLSSVEDIWEVLTRTWRWGGVDEEAAQTTSASGGGLRVRLWRAVAVGGCDCGERWPAGEVVLSGDGWRVRLWQAAAGSCFSRIYGFWIGNFRFCSGSGFYTWSGLRFSEICF